jgi:hypothetical protein
VKCNSTDGEVEG